MDPSVIFHLAFNALVEHTGAHEGSWQREGFVDFFVNSKGHEWRFQGNLGFGGKFFRTGTSYRVSCYREDWTPERGEMVRKVNEILKDLPYYEPSARQSLESEPASDSDDSEST